MTAVACDGDDGADGIASFAGFSAGDLTVVQTTAPDGYLLAGPIGVHVGPGVATDVVVTNDPIPAPTSTPTEAATQAPTSTPMPTPTAASTQTTVHAKAPTQPMPVSAAAGGEFGAGEGALIVKTVDGAGDAVNECIALQRFPHSEDFYSIVCDNQYYRFPVGNRLEQFQHLDPDVRIGYVEATALPAGD